MWRGNCGRWSWKPASTPNQSASRARLLEVILEERAGQVEANVQNNLRMLRAC